MKLLSALAALLPLTAAFPSLNPRQAATVQITDVMALGPGCDPDSFTKSVSNSSTDATFGFDAYESSLGPGVAGEEREKHCQIFFTLRFPLGCTAATLSTTYHGFAALGDGATGVLAPSYNLSPGDLEVALPPPDFFEGAEWAEGDTYERTDDIVAKVQIGDEEHRDVQFVVRSRTLVQSTGEAEEGLITADDITVSIKDSKSC